MSGMGSTTSGAPRIRRALLSEADRVLGVLDEAASWASASGLQQWPTRFEPAWIEPDIAAGTTWLVTVDDDAVGTITITDTDELWDDGAEADAIYIHRLAVRRQRAGLGRAILSWVDERAARLGTGRVRLDCAAANSGLRRYYETAGFEYRGDRLVGGAPGDWDHTSAEPTVVALYEHLAPETTPILGDRVVEADPVANLDVLMAEAWPPSVTEQHGPWIFRYANGVSRRANSVLALGMPDDVGSAISQAEAFYRHHGAEPLFFVSDASTPVTAEAQLTDAGYIPSAATWMMKGSTSEVSRSLTVNERWQIEVSDHPTDRWFDAYWELESARHSPADDLVMRSQLLAPDAPARFVAVSSQGQVAAVGQVVIIDDWGCLQCLVTRPMARRQGAASQVFRALVDEASAVGADHAFAAVAAENRASLHLCRGTGLHPSHRYRYFHRG
ncbi:MAG: GNAT family N-acetyltransferase [Actinomycetia bacterium]|nr:GNAT family N-acetyltransferase [Actinomycetes bacterium]